MCSLATPLPFRSFSPCLPRRQYGNVSRFVNHACGAAANLRCWHECGRRRVVLYPTRPIRPGEELTFDYGLFSLSTKTPGQAQRRAADAAAAGPGDPAALASRTKCVGQRSHCQRARVTIGRRSEIDVKGGS